MTRLCCATFVLLLSTSALAQTDRVVQEPDRTVFPANTEIRFGEVEVDGKIARPIDSYTLGRRPPKFGRQFKVRGDFVPELQKSVDSL